MAATGTPTPNIGLRIPQGTDPASVDDINYNSNLLDTKLGAVGNDSVQDQIDDLNSKLTYSELTSGITTGIRAYKWGRVVMLNFEGCHLTSAVPENTNFSSITSAYFPIYAVSFVDTIQKKRIVIDTDGKIHSAGEALSAGVLRGVITYISAT